MNNQEATYRCPNCGGDITKIKMPIIGKVWKCANCKAGFGQGEAPNCYQ